MTKFEEAKREARNRELRIETLSDIYDEIENNYHWNYCQYNEETKEFRELEKPENYNEASGDWDSRNYYKAQIYKEVLKLIEKAI